MGEGKEGAGRASHIGQFSCRWEWTFEAPRGGEGGAALKASLGAVADLSCSAFALQCAKSGS